MKKFLAVVALVAAISLLFGLRITHPQAGLSSAMGSAQSSLAIYKSVGQAAVGDKVLVPVKGMGTELGVVKSARGGTVDVDTVGTFVRVKQSDVVGKLVAIIPFFGIPFGWVGL